MSALILDEYEGLFRDHESFTKFVQVLEEKLRDDFSPVLSKAEILGAFLSSEATKDVIYDRLIQRMGRNPDLLDELKRRIEDDKTVGLEEML